jgi:hypothetical protein
MARGFSGRLRLGYAAGQRATADAGSAAKRPLISHANMDTRLFRVATKLFNHLFLNGTAEDRPASKTFIDISGL